MSNNIKVKLNQNEYRKLANDIANNISVNGIQVECPYCKEVVLIHANREVCPHCGREFEINIML